ncbi:MAG: acetate--CoA ligase family protein [Thermoprotei archaeon]
MARSDSRNFLLEPECDEVLRAYGIPVVDSFFAKTPEEAVKASEKLGFPLVEKVVSPDVLHKSDVGGVKVGISNPDEVAKAFTEIESAVKSANPKARFYGVYLQKMLRGGVETIVGGTRDPQFGPVVVFGLGGIFVEILKDVSFRVAPLSEDDAIEMMNEIKAAAILNGVRGSKPVDKVALARIIVSVGALMAENKEISSLDLNPVMATPDGAVAVDSRIILGD